MEMKVFGVGLPRSGGQTLGRALHILYGAPAIHSPGNNWQAVDNARCSVELFAPPWWLDGKYRCKIIYNDRDEQDWLASCKSVYHLSAQWNHPLWKYHIDQFSAYRDDYLEGWLAQDHLQRSRRDACGGESNFLLHDFTKDPSWEPLCDFLKLPNPGVAFPRVDAVKPSTVVYPPLRTRNLAGWRI
jgi:hypothetical protein